MEFLCSAINNAANMTELLDILTHGKSELTPNPAKSYISFFGHRIFVPGYRLSVTHLSIIHRVVVLVNEKKIEFTLKEIKDRELVIEIIHRLDDESRELLNRSCRITRIFFYLSEFFVQLYYYRTFNRWYKDLIYYSLTDS